MKIERKNRNNWYLSMIMLMFLGLSSAFAQPIRFSLYVSPLLSYAETDFQVDKKTLARFSSGFEASYFFRENYEIGTGVRLSHIGFKMTHDGHDIKMSGKYVEIPVNLRLSTDEIGYFTYYGKFGLIAGFKSSEKITISPDPKVEEHERFLADVMGSFELGGGVEYNLGGQVTLFGELSFRNNFTNAIYNDRTPYSGHEKVHLNTLALTIGAIF